MTETGGRKWSPEGMSQDDFMLKDECIVLNYMDEVVGHDNKYNCHKFIPGQPRGILHRAFSVMLFDADGKLLVQQRAASKVTFPGVWTNTCCSHPLHGMQPPELDYPKALASGDPVGVKHAAIRKLGHELGIPSQELDVAGFKFMTRVHYWAADVLTYGEEAPWGEHEIDYLLLYRLKPGQRLTVQPHPEEVSAFKWMSKEEVNRAMAGGDDPLAREMPRWSPWFRIITERFLKGWWQDLDAALASGKHVDTTIHRFDTPAAFHGGAGGAGPYLNEVADAEAAARKLGSIESQRRVVLDAEHNDRILGFLGRAETDDAANAVKQGGYGKVPTHSHSAMEILLRPRELGAALRFKFAGLLVDNITMHHTSEDVTFCNEMLGKVSRSFAFVIRQLSPNLCLDICVFYLVLRALDTVEDDMDAYKGRESEKEKELRNFSQRLNDPDCSISGVGAGDEAVLIQNFGKVVRVFKSLPSTSQEVIRDITVKMGNGMADYIPADLAQGTVDQEAYDRYCHKVAGLVGEGLTRMFVGCGMEDQSLCAQGERVWPFCADASKEPANLGLANSMGLFLQKTNIIRDYLEDYVDGRAFWPQTVWRRYAITGELGEFARPTAHGLGKVLPCKESWGAVAAKGVGVQALQCLDELVADALELVPDCLEYLARLQDGGNFRFCAIPQVMAIATLAAVFDNPKLFTGVVKLRKGLTARLICACVDGRTQVKDWFVYFARSIAATASSKSCSANEETVKRIIKACDRILEKAGSGASQEGSLRTFGLISLGVVAAAVLGARMVSA